MRFEFSEETALIVVDMINDFARSDGALFVPDAVEIIDEIAELIMTAREKGIPIIHVTDAHDPDDKEFENWGRHAVAGTEGAQVIDELAPSDDDAVILKKTFSSFYETDLDRVLDEKDIGHLVVTGTVTNICIYATVMEAVLRGYRVTVPRDAVAGLDPDDHRFALKQMEEILGAEVV